MIDENLQDIKYFKLEMVYDNRILIITLDRPPVNAFIAESYIEMERIMNFVACSKEICAVVMQANGKMFSAGADVKRLGTDTLEEAAKRRALLRKSGEVVYNCPVPLIIAAHGPALGVGLVYVTCGDIVIAAEDALFSLPEIDVFVVGGAAGLSKFLPRQKIKTIALTGDKITAQEAHRLGAVEKVVALEDLRNTALEYAKKCADKGYLAVHKWKESLLVTEGIDPRAGLLVEMCLSQELGILSPKPRIRKS